MDLKKWRTTTVYFTINGSFDYSQPIKFFSLASTFMTRSYIIAMSAVQIHREVLWVYATSIQLCMSHKLKLERIGCQRLKGLHHSLGDSAVDYFMKTTTEETKTQMLTSCDGMSPLMLVVGMPAYFRSGLCEPALPCIAEPSSEGVFDFRVCFFMDIVAYMAYMCAQLTRGIPPNTSLVGTDAEGLVLHLLVVCESNLLS
ncbi:hypothetical protein NE237_025458 [Protea cynaroides]|uniref:Uncharacterized protein n=1 Tax=Protea cynaroides TaxID=273540 RepID=A0A9Q0H6A2_9MAGN|nr:hypothetical protein NE237_025458 [Protea cynaroides]